MKWTVGTKIGGGFLLSVIVFVCVGTVTYRSTTSLIDASEWRRHTYDVLRALAELESISLEMQNSVRGYAVTGNETYLEPYQSALLRSDKIVEEIRTLTADNPAQQRRIDSMEPLVKQRFELFRETVAAIRADGPEAGLRIIKSGKGRSLTAEIRKIIDQMEREEKTLLDHRAAAAEWDALATKWTILIGTVIAMGVAAVAGTAITRNIAGPLGQLTRIADRITVGDMESTVSIGDRSDEVGSLAKSFQAMTVSLRTMAAAADRIASGNLLSTVTPISDRDLLGNAFATMVTGLREQISGLIEGTNVLGSAASEIVASTSQLAASANQAAAAVSETTTTVEEVRQTAQLSAQKARHVAESAQRAAQISQNGRKSTEEVGAGMERIRQQMDAIAGSMMRLSEQSQAIGQIMATVEDLAAQSNLLAVNAAMEAAKAGEQGKGFGVVAQEVKSLAEQSRQATNQVRTILNDIQKATSAAVMATEQGSKAVEAGTRQTQAAGESIQSLTGSVAEAAQAATQIAASSQQQLVGVDQVASAMDSIKQSSAQNVASAQQLETAARNISDLGRRLTQMVARYQVSV